MLESAQAVAEVRSRAQAVRDTIVALLTELTRSCQLEISRRTFEDASAACFVRYELEVRSRFLDL